MDGFLQADASHRKGIICLCLHPLVCGVYIALVYAVLDDALIVPGDAACLYISCNLPQVGSSLYDS